MPLYTIMTQTGALSDSAKAKLAGELTAFHTEYAGVPENWVHVVFQDYAPGSGFHGGAGGLVRVAHALGPDRAVRRLQNARCSSVSGTWYRMRLVRLTIRSSWASQEVPPSQAMEMGRDHALRRRGSPDARWRT